jgi:PAS domain S-box-containing protein
MDLLSEDRLRVTLASIGDALITTDLQGRITFVNAVAEKLTGWKESEALGASLESVFRMVDERTRQPVGKVLAAVLAQGLPAARGNHALLLARDGTERPIEDQASALRNPDGGLDGMVLVFREVSERRAAEHAAQRLAALVENSEDAIISKDLRGLITSWNKGAERMFGYAKAEMLGRAVMTIVPPERQPEEREILERLARGERFEHFETVRVDQRGRLLQVSLSISPILIEGRVVGASTIARDITEPKRVQRELQEAREQLAYYNRNLEDRVRERTALLERSVKELEAFSYSMSHDLRGPLRAIRSFTEMVLDEHKDRLSADGCEMLAKVIQAANRLDHLIQDLLHYARLSRDPVSCGPVNPESLLHAILRERREFQPPNALVTVESPLLWMRGNETLLSQCLANLLENAVKYVAPGIQPRVRVFSEPVGDEVRLWIEDNGIGIEARGQKRLFQMFQRLHASDYEGTGMGLAIVRKAMERLGGRVGVESEPGAGSRFWLELPAARRKRGGKARFPGAAE